MTNSIFTNASGRPLTKGLFYENSSEDKTGVVYTLKDRDHEGYPSLYRLYMECGDPTEYDFATKYLDGWGHWQTLCNCNWFKEYVDRWRWELELKIKSEALRRIQNEAKASEKNGFAANRFLVDGGWLERKAKNEVGRPTQERIRKEAERLNQIEKEILEDHARIN